MRKLELETETLREKCPNTEFLLVRTFPHSNTKRRDTEYLSVFSRNAGKWGPEETSYLDTFYPVFSVFSRIQSECGKIRTRKNSVFGHFSLSEIIGFKASSRNLIVVSLQHI